MYGCPWWNNNNILFSYNWVLLQLQAQLHFFQPTLQRYKISRLQLLEHIHSCSFLPLLKSILFEIQSLNLSLISANQAIQATNMLRLQLLHKLNKIPLLITWIQMACQIFLLKVSTPWMFLGFDILTLYLKSMLNPILCSFQIWLLSQSAKRL